MVLSHDVGPLGVLQDVRLALAALRNQEHHFGMNRVDRAFTEGDESAEGAAGYDELAGGELAALAVLMDHQ
jgi:hypothetical protein